MCVCISPDDITGIAWLDYGVLAVAAGNQLRCYLKWLTRADRIQHRMYIKIPFFFSFLLFCSQIIVTNNNNKLISNSFHPKNK